MEDAVLALVDKVNALETNLVNTQTRLAEATAELASRGAASATSSSGPSDRSINRMKDIGTVAEYTEGTPWAEWSVKARALLGAWNPLLIDLLRHAERADGALNLSLSSVEQKRASEQLYAWLVLHTSGEFLKIILASGDGEGLEGWRKLYQHHQPKIHMRYVQQVVALIRYNFEPDPVAKLSSFDLDVSEYETSSGEVFPESNKIGAVLASLKPSHMRDHLLMNAERLRTCDAFKT